MRVPLPYEHLVSLPDGSQREIQDGATADLASEIDEAIQSLHNEVNGEETDLSKMPDGTVVNIITVTLTKGWKRGTQQLMC